MIELAYKKIDNVPIVLMVDETYSDKVIAGQPILYIGKELVVIYAVDTLKTIKAIYNSSTLNELNDNVKGIWAEDIVERIIVEMEG